MRVGFAAGAERDRGRIDGAVLRDEEPDKKKTNKRMMTDREIMWLKNTEVARYRQSQMKRGGVRGGEMDEAEEQS